MGMQRLPAARSGRRWLTVAKGQREVNATLILRQDDLIPLIGLPEAMAAVRQGLTEQAAGQVIQPHRLTFDSGNGWLRLMPASLPRLGVMGYKAMHLTHGAGVRYVTCVYDLADGTLLAMLDADWLTVIRTAATSAVAMDHLALPHVEKAAVIGSGVQAGAHLQALLAVRRPSWVAVYSRDSRRRADFAERMTERLGLPVRPVESPRAAVAGAAVVIVAVKAGTVPVLQAEWLTPGVHVTGISSVRPEAREVDDAVWQRAQAVVVDDRDHVLQSGDGQSALQSGSIQPENLTELWEVASGKHPGRIRLDDITLFKSVGTAWQDVVVAFAAVRAARTAGRGLDVGAFPVERLPAGLPGSGH